MTAVLYRHKLTPTEAFVVADEVCGHGALVSSDIYTFISWELSHLVARVEQEGETFTLGLEPGLTGVDETVGSNALFICTPEEFEVFQRQQMECSCQ